MPVEQVLFGVMQTPLTQAPNKQLASFLQPEAAVAAMAEGDWQRTLLSPTMPVYPWRQLPHVLAVLWQVARWRAVQLGATVQLIALSIELTALMD